MKNRVIEVLKNKLTKEELHELVTVWEVGNFDDVIYGGIIQLDCENYPADYDSTGEIT